MNAPDALPFRIELQARYHKWPKGTHHYPPDPMVDWGGTLKQIRQDLGITQSQLSKAWGVCLPTINTWENRQGLSPQAIANIRALERHTRAMCRARCEFLDAPFPKAKIFPRAP